MATAQVQRAEKGKSGSTVNMQGTASSVHLVFPIGVFASPLRPRHMFTGRCKYAANLLALSLGTTRRCKYGSIIARRMCLIVARPSLRCPLAGEAGATIHDKYAANIARRRLEKRSPPRAPQSASARPAAWRAAWPAASSSSSWKASPSCEREGGHTRLSLGANPHERARARQSNTTTHLPD